MCADATAREPYPMLFRKVADHIVALITMSAFNGQDISEHVDQGGAVVKPRHVFRNAKGAHNIGQAPCIERVQERYSVAAGDMSTGHLRRKGRRLPLELSRTIKYPMLLELSMALFWNWQ